MTFTDLPFVPRFPNQMKDVAAFLEHWNAGIAYSPLAKIVHSPWRNLNSTGQGHESPAPDLTPADNAWPELVEARIRPLVVLLVEKFELITYDSCEGHEYPVSLGLQNAPRRVGIIPRSKEESDRVSHLLLKAYRETRKAFCDWKMVLNLYRTHLYSDAQPGRTWVALDVELRPARGPLERAYFDSLDSVTNAFVQALKNQSIGLIGLAVAGA